MPAGPRKCLGGCGRWLTDPESLARGYGKTCAGRHGIDTSLTPAARTPPASPVPSIPGQTELPLTDHQPTLWSL
jgi:hypothetical protein